MISSNSASMKRTRNFAFLILAGCIACTSGLGQTLPFPTGTISGTVKDEAGRELPDAKIVLSSADTSSTNPRAATDKKGFYTFGGIKLGHYSVSVSANGFHSSQDVDIDVNSASATDDFTHKPLLKS